MGLWEPGLLQAQLKFLFSLDCSRLFFCQVPPLMDKQTNKCGRRWRKLGIWAAAILLLYTITGFFIVPAIIKSQMFKRLPAITHREAAIQSVRFNPFALSLTLRGFSLKETNGEVFNSFDEFYANFQLSSIFRRKWTFDEIHLKEPFIQITYRQDGTFNFANLISNSNPAPPSATPTPAASPIPGVLIYRLNITNGVVAFTDLTRKSPFRNEYKPIQLELVNFTTVRNQNSPYSFIARSEPNEVFSWSGNVTINPLSSSGTFRIGGIHLEIPSLEPGLRKFEVTSGTIDVAADYHYDSATNALDLSISNGIVQLNEFEL